MDKEQKVEEDKYIAELKEFMVVISDDDEPTIAFFFRWQLSLQALLTGRYTLRERRCIEYHER